MRAGWLACLALLAGASAHNSPAHSTDYVRPGRSAELELQHPLLSRAGTPHQPEQIHLALALSPGAVAISWVTHPQARRAPALPCLQQLSLCILICTPAPEPVKRLSWACGCAQEDLQLTRRKHKKKHQDPGCKHLEDYNLSSVVQWSTQPGTLAGHAGNGRTSCRPAGWPWRWQQVTPHS